ncbi:uncharacterized protein B0P05DRAFT_555753 [Gilbertella persicaria]|uniref:Kinesin protein 1B n=1 Tax=Rhizopus stolonifer TaxID=4846 RepID=A0A367KW84_RHIST|nr:uncharacterized protein B0P05DRAFT_555753 [Gilbertella persicaria]KAI8063402.1 hypothetical protein B0P05DRAFT_555753 [Gilbertella persicaria]RCI06473.1 Kinesin protein 1B [Rhizopus stolonifer]
MFERPKKTLEHSLFTVLENAQDYVADVYFKYPHTKLWAHKALLMVRVPPSFQQKYLPQLADQTQFDISAVIPYTTLRQLLRFWYTARFTPPPNETSLLSSAIHGLSLSEASSNLQSEVESNLHQEISSLEIKLGVDMLPKGDPEQQWVADLSRMLDQQICTDVTVYQDVQPVSSFPAHRFMLASQSPYFYSVFCTEFREASTSSVHMPSDLFSAATLDVILHYLYTDQLILPDLLDAQPTRLNQKKHELRILQKVFPAADFLGHADTICKAVLLKMAVLCHQFKCVCSECAALLPSMLVFADQHQKHVPKLRSNLIALYADPLDSLAPLWSQKPFAILVSALQKPQAKETQLSDIFATPTPTTPTEDSVISDITQRTWSNMTKHNSVRSLHSLHLCLSYLRGADPFPTWSQPVIQILNQFLHYNVEMIANHFDYYCVEYPILLSCVDGIGFGFSVDFLSFVLQHVLNEGIHDGNAAILYQGIVRDLGNRQEMVRNVAVDGVLMDARLKCAQYLAKRWMSVKAEHGFATIEKDYLRMISEDINVPMRTLTKPLENDISTIFSFKPRKAKKEDGVKRLSFPLQTQDDTQAHVRPYAMTTSQSHSDTEDVSLQRRNSTFRSFRRHTSDDLTDELLALDLRPMEPRQTRLRFSLPTTPSRIRPQKRVAVKKNKRSKSPGRSRWSLGYSTSDSSDDEIMPAVGQKVELLRRPLPTLGTIKYIGPVEFAKGTWVGVELESRLGNNDGSVDGKRYFQTFPQRGVFIKTDDFKILADKKN